MFRILLLLTFFALVSCKIRPHPLQNASFTFDPEDLEVIFAKTTHTIQVILPHCELPYAHINVTSVEERIFTLEYDVIAPEANPNSSCYVANVTLFARNIGITNFTANVVYDTPDDTCYESVELQDAYEVQIQRPPGIEKEVKQMIVHVHVQHTVRKHSNTCYWYLFPVADLPAGNGRLPRSLELRFRLLLEPGGCQGDLATSVRSCGRVLLPVRPHADREWHSMEQVLSSTLLQWILISAWFLRRDDPASRSAALRVRSDLLVVRAWRIRK